MSDETNTNTDEDRRSEVRHDNRIITGMDRDEQLSHVFSAAATLQRSYGDFLRAWTRLWFPQLENVNGWERAGQR